MSDNFVDGLEIQIDRSERAPGIYRCKRIHTLENGDGVYQVYVNSHPTSLAFISDLESRRENFSDLIHGYTCY